MDLDTTPWPGLTYVEEITEGSRNRVWRGVLGAIDVSVRESRRSLLSLDWELDLIEYLDDLGFLVASVIRTRHGARHNGGVVVQRWLPGRAPESQRDWLAVAACLQALHRATTAYPQRPDCLTVTELTVQSRSLDADLRVLPADVAADVLAAFATVSDCATSVVHGDPGAANLRITEAGDVGLLDFDESRVDVTWHDLSNLGICVLDPADHVRARRLSDAWETANGWTLENAHAQRRLESLRRAAVDVTPPL